MKIYHGLKLLTHCGGGAYGDVYFCEDLTGKKMAVKIVSKNRLGNSWERELKGVINYRKITENSPALLQIFHVEEDEESFFYTMEAADSTSETEYIPDTLANRLQSGPLPQAELLPVLQGIFCGIKAIHNAGLTHRDIKPDNILFVKGVPKLADIGLVSSLSATMTQLAGTLEFIPPEERVADSSDYTDKNLRQRNDLYAFGKVIYCAVTGTDPQNFPTIPTNIPLSLPLKYFSRLAFQLCAKDPVRRLDSLSKLEHEFSEIERKLLFGETFNDCFIYGIKTLGNMLKSALFGIGKVCKRYWYFVLFLLLLGGTAAYFMFRPEPPIDITKLKIKEYKNKQYNFSLQIPYHWEIISPETIKEIIAKAAEDKDNTKGISKENIERIKQVAQLGQTIIYCDYEAPLPDMLAIKVSSFTEDYLSNVSLEEFRLQFKFGLEKVMKLKSIIFDVKKIYISGRLCLFVDYAYIPGVRFNAYFISLGDKTIEITTSMKEKYAEQRKAEYKAVLNTLKIYK